MTKLNTKQTITLDNKEFIIRMITSQKTIRFPEQLLKEIISKYQNHIHALGFRFVGLTQDNHIMVEILPITITLSPELKTLIS